MYKMSRRDRIAYCMACIEDVLKTIGPSRVVAIEKALYVLHPGVYRSLYIDHRRLAHYLRLYASPDVLHFKCGDRNIYYLTGQNLEGVLGKKEDTEEYSIYEIPDAE